MEIKYSSINVDFIYSHINKAVKVGYIFILYVRRGCRLQSAVGPVDHGPSLEVGLHSDRLPAVTGPQGFLPFDAVHTTGIWTQLPRDNTSPSSRPASLAAPASAWRPSQTACRPAWPSSLMPPTCLRPRPHRPLPIS